MSSTCSPLWRLGSTACLLIMSFLPAAVIASNITMQTPLGAVEIELFDEETPKTVANFLKYVNDGAYDNSFIHRSDPDFVLQGGGYFDPGPGAQLIPTNPPVMNEPGISNVRGTVAMAKLPDAPDSATNQWFINLVDNSSLDDANGGYTVFGRVSDEGMEVIDQIADLPVWNAGGPFGELPLIGFTGAGLITTEHLVMTEFQLETEFPISQGLTDSWYFPGTDGQGFTIIVYPQLGSIFLTWFTFDTERPDADSTAMLGDPGHRWLTAQGSFTGNTAVLDVYITSGGVFDSGSPEPVTVKDGTITLEFSGCNAGSVSYDIPSIGRQDVVPIERVFADEINIAWCEEATSAASFPVNVQVDEPAASKKAQ